MLIYIIEDSPTKAAQLTTFLKERWSCAHIRLFASFQSGLREVESVSPDLIVLDMTLPTFDRKANGREGRLRPLGGYDLMRKMRLKQISARVVVITQLESFGEGEETVNLGDITSRCEREFPDFFIGSVYFDQSAGNWKTQLDDLLFDIK